MMTEIILSGKKNGMSMMLLFIALYIGAFLLVIVGAASAPLLMVLGILWLCIGWFPFLGAGADALRQVCRDAEGRGLLLCQSILHRGQPRRKDQAEPERRCG